MNKTKNFSHTMLVSGWQRKYSISIIFVKVLTYQKLRQIDHDDAICGGQWIPGQNIYAMTSSCSQNRIVRNVAEILGDMVIDFTLIFKLSETLNTLISFGQLLDYYIKQAIFDQSLVLTLSLRSIKWVHQPLPSERPWLEGCDLNSSRWSCSITSVWIQNIQF